MKKEGHIIGRIGLVVLAVMLISLLGVFSVNASAKMKINKKKATVYVGKTVKLKVKNTHRKVKWKSSKKSVATVSKKGVVKGKKAGKATITAKVGGKSFKCKVTVKRGRIVSRVSDTVKASIVNTLTTYGKTDSDSDGFHYYLDYIDYGDDFEEYYTTVRYYPNSGLVEIGLMMERTTLVNFEIRNSNDGYCDIMFYDNYFEQYGEGYLNKSLINQNTAVTFVTDNFGNSNTRYAAEKLTTSSAKLSLIYFDIIMMRNGSSISHSDLGFYF